MSRPPQDDALYKSLENSTSVRLLSIKPGYLADKLECALVTVDKLEDAPPYEALSYVWGSEQSAETIVCNGVEKSVTVNLWEALKHLRPLPSWNYQNAWDRNHLLHSHRNVWRDFARHRFEDCSNIQATDRLVWIDALCINQNDPHERASQVKLMRKIYKRAHLVRIWLGNEDTQHFAEAGKKGWNQRLVAKITPRHHIGNYGDVPVLLTFLAQALKNADGGTNRLVSMKPSDDSDFRNRAYGLPPPSAAEWSLVRQFYAHPWFQRVWVIQEVVLADRAIIILGDWEIEWSAVGRAANWFQQKGYGLPAMPEYTPSKLNDSLPISNAVAAWNMSFAEDKRMPLLYLLRESRSRLSSKDVDRLYAILGLAKEISSLHGDKYDALIEPNYQKSTQDVFRDATRYLIIEHGNLDVLSQAGGAQTEMNSGWPSWVPKWHERKISGDYAGNVSRNIYSAGSGGLLAVGIPRSPNCLPLAGVRVDKIQSFGQKLTSYGFGAQVHQEERDFVMAAWTIFHRQTHSQQETPYLSTPQVGLSFMSTMTAGLSSTLQASEVDFNYGPDALAWFSRHLGSKVPILPWPQRLAWRANLKSPDPGRFHEAFVRACRGRRFFVTQSGYMGMGPHALKEGDIIVVLFGGSVPYVLRQLDDGLYHFVGDCFVAGLMKGEALSGSKPSQSPSEVFELV